MSWILRGLVFVAAVVLVVPVQADILLQDDFNDNSLDASKWWVNLTGIPQDPKSVTETGGHIALEGRGHLNTAQQFDPATYANPIEITGQWTYISGGDFFQVLTRSSGQPSGGYGETSSGIEFYLPVFSVSSMSISGRGAAVSGLVRDFSHLTLGTNNVFNFRIVDDGTNLLWQMVDADNPSNQGWAMATSTTNMPTDYIVFHNRESGNRSDLDNVLIVEMPEPSALVGLFGLAAVGLVAWFRRRGG